MAPISPGFQLAPSRKAKKQTTSTNLHRYESFTKRIAKLKIDPVHTVERRNPSDADKDLLQSFFRTSLEEWAELNLSQTFTSFHSKVNPLCENLPQLLHHADTIFSLLAEHINKKDELALEALLALLAHLAHDLGQNFERYFSKTVELVTQVAASEEKADVIEWCFTCLAWMFKYLARLLVQDLRPLLNIMAPYLSSKKDYIVRFSAESLAFLLRKAAVLYQKKTGPLALSIKHLMEMLPKDDVSPPYSPYQLGVMSLCVDTARGLDGQLHSCSPSLAQCLLDTSLAMSDHAQVLPIVEGILIGLIHETDSSTFHPVSEVVLETVRHCAASKERNQVSFAVRLLLVLLTTRRGSRISDWAVVIEILLSLAQTASQSSEELPQLHSSLATITAQIIQYAPMGQVLPFSQKLLDFAAEHFSVCEFFAFSALCAELGKERFTDLVLPKLQQYIVKHWSDDEVGLYYTLERLRQDDIAVGRAASSGSLVLPSDYEIFAVRQLTATAKAEDASTIQQLAGRLRLAKNTRLLQTSDHTTTAVEAYQNLLGGALGNSAGDFDLRQRIILGWGLDSYLDIFRGSGQSLHDLAVLVLQTPPIFLRQPSFLRTLVRLLKKLSSVQKLEDRASDNTRHLLVQNLLASSSGLKGESLALLSLLEAPDSHVKKWLTETTDLMLDLLGTSYTPSEVRKIAMLLRRLPQLHRNAPADSAYQDLVPFFCLGLLSSYHDKARNEVCNILSQLVEMTLTEESVLNIALTWLQAPIDTVTQQPKGGDQVIKHLSSFECSHLAQVESLSASVFNDFHNSTDRFGAMVEDAHQAENVETPRNGRSLALRVLTAIPASAERRSRLLVPVFMAAPFSRGQLPANPDASASVSSHTVTPESDDHAWSLTDRKALLALFSKFVNPRVLYKSADVQIKLIDLLSNGNDEIRKLALQAVLSWKDQTLARYESKLLQLADGKLSASEISTFLSSDEDADCLRPTDRATVLPIALRLVYGTIVGRAGTSGSQEARRKSLLRALFRLTNHEVSTFLHIALGKLREVKVHGSPHNLASLDEIFVPEDQQYGFLRLLLSILETLQSQFAQYGQEVVDAVVSCIIKVSHQGQHGVKSAPTAALPRNIRRTGFQCLVLLFEHCQDIDWSRYLPVLFADAISPRLDIFASETTQGISGLMRLFAVWARSYNLVRCLGDYDSRVPDVLWHSLAAQPTPTAVKLFILDEIVLRWTEIAEDSSILPNKAHDLLEIASDGLLKALVVLLERTPPREILTAVTAILPRLARFAKSSDSRVSAVKLLTSLLCDSGLKVAPIVKGQLLRSIRAFLSDGETLDQDLCRQLIGSISLLFNYFKDESNRQVLCEVLELLSVASELPGSAARLCKDLNAVSSQRLEEVDYDRRLQAFQTVQILDINKFGSSCLPIVYNLIYFIRTSEDFTIRSNALGCLKQMIIRGCAAKDPEVRNLIVASVLPVAKKCTQHESELVRADFVSLLGLLVQHAQHNEDLANMVPLLVGNDEEASFFLNILHIQQHRRLRAIRRLESEIETGAISTKNIVEIFIPLLEMFVNDTSNDESAQGTKGQAIAAMGTVLRWLDWKHFKALFRRYRSAVDLTNGEQKAAVRLLGHATDALLSATEISADSEEGNGDQRRPRLAEALPEKSIIQQELKGQFIPKLTELIHYKDEAEISLRLPIAVISLKLVTLLPPDEVPMVASPVILDIANILKSRAQESRDAARKSLCEIVLLLGPNSLQFVVKEMRTALTRGYQLHVVSYTLHSILVALTPHTKHGDLDYCVEELVPVIMDDIFGTVGQEKDNQDYVSTMREVKSSKSFDSMELLARSISIASVSKLVAPIQILLVGPLTTKQVRKIDELLRRTGMGLAQNPSAGKRDILTFAYQMIQGLYQQKAGNEVRTLTNDEKNRHRYLIQLSSASKRTESQTSALLYKLARFALDLVRSTLQRYPDVLTSENVHGFLPVIGDALIESQEDVKISALRLLSAIIKLPMQELEDNAAFYVVEAVKFVNASTNTNEEGAQAALKLIAAVLRERRNVQIRDSDVAQLLHRITPDIEEPDRQGVTFNFIRAVMARKIQMPEVYELADKIGMMMVTNQTKGARDVARGVFVHFLLEYPQSSSRWSKQQKFLMKNLEYEHPEGRQSVMEAINTLIAKMKGDTAQKLISAFFIPILLRMINDDNEGCRQLAGALLGRLFSLADRTRLTEMFQPLNTWAEQETNLTLRKVSLQAYGILFDADVSLNKDELGQAVNSLSAALRFSDMDDQDDWELRFQALLLLQKLTESYPESVLNGKQNSLWSSVWSSLSHHEAWIQSTSATLCIQFLSHCVSADRSNLPLACKYGLSMNSEAFMTVLRASVRVLRRTEGKENLGSQIVQILGFLGQCLDQNELSMEVKQTSTAEEHVDVQSEDESEVEGGGQTNTRTISGVQYLLDQLTRILRVEANRLTTAAFLPKTLALQLLSNLVPELSTSNLPLPQIHEILLPLQHITDPSTIAPRSADPTFSATYQTLVELSHEVMQRLQKKLGDAGYVQALTEVSKMMRQRRDERRSKRKIERIAEPEKAARDKKRKHDRARERRKEISKTHQRRRREVG